MIHINKIRFNGSNYSTLKKLLRIDNYRHKYYSDKVITCLGIETSCDDSSCSVVSSDRAISSLVTIPQFKIHEPMGGIVPNLALKSHIRNLPLAVRKALEEAKIKVENIDVIAVTRGPGLPSSLSVGLNAAKTLAAALNKPLIGVHHMEAHALTVRLCSESIQFPYLTLLVSGGHTMIVLVKGINNSQVLGSTLDESVGECFDKVSRALKLSWNVASTHADGSLKTIDDTKVGGGGGAGPALELKAREGDDMKYKLTIPLFDMHRKNMIAFSFSGLRTQVTQRIENQLEEIQPDEMPKFQADMAASFQRTAFLHLTHKLKLAIDQCFKQNINLTGLVVSGGVAANSTLRLRVNELAKEFGLESYYPPQSLCTDNAAMIAWTGLERFQLGLTDSYTIDFKPDWHLHDLGKPECSTE